MQGQHQSTSLSSASPYHPATPVPHLSTASMSHHQSPAISTTPSTHQTTAAISAFAPRHPPPAAAQSASQQNQSRHGSATAPVHHQPTTAHSHHQPAVQHPPASLHRSERPSMLPCVIHGSDGAHALDNDIVPNIDELQLPTGPHTCVDIALHARAQGSYVSHRAYTDSDISKTAIPRVLGSFTQVKSFVAFTLFPLLHMTACNTTWGAHLSDARKVTMTSDISYVNMCVLSLLLVLNLTDRLNRDSLIVVQLFVRHSRRKYPRCMVPNGVIWC